MDMKIGFDLERDFPKVFDDQEAREILMDDIRLRSLC
jgi:hypothetical protein